MLGVMVQSQVPVVMNSRQKLHVAQMNINKSLYEQMVVVDKENEQSKYY